MDSVRSQLLRTRIPRGWLRSRWSGPLPGRSKAKLRARSGSTPSDWSGVDDLLDPAGVGLAYAALWNGGVPEKDWCITLLFIGTASMVYWLRTPRELAPEARVVDQMARPGFDRLRRFSARASSHGSFGSPVPGTSTIGTRSGACRAGDPFAPISVSPMATVEQLLRLVGYAAVFFLVRELTWNRRTGRGGLRCPLFSSQPRKRFGNGAILAHRRPGHRNLCQSGSLRGIARDGSPVECCVWGHHPAQGWFPHSFPGRTGLVGVCPARLWWFDVSRVALSLSRGGFLAALFGLGVLGILFAGEGLTRNLRRVLAACVFSAVLLGFVFLPPDALIHRFADMAGTEELSADTRMRSGGTRGD